LLTNDRDRDKTLYFNYLQPQTKLWENEWQILRPIDLQNSKGAYKVRHGSCCAGDELESAFRLLFSTVFPWRFPLGYKPVEVAGSKSMVFCGGSKYKFLKCIGDIKKSQFNAVLSAHDSLLRRRFRPASSGVEGQSECRPINEADDAIRRSQE
jgi:hypothetical protein